MGGAVAVPMWHDRRVMAVSDKKLELLFRRAEGLLLDESGFSADISRLASDEALQNLRELQGDLERSGKSERLKRLERAAGAHRAEAEEYIEKHGICGVMRHPAGDATVFMLPIETLPNHVNNIYAIVREKSHVLFDCGSGIGVSKRDIEFTLSIVRSVFKTEVHLERFDWCVISHAHVDHFGGANELKQHSNAKIAVHELDARVLEQFEERLVVTAKDIDIYWRRAGVSDEECAVLRELYSSTKLYVKSEPVQLKLEDGDRVEGYQAHHVPGHCPGLICLQVNDVLLTSDHVLARITPHQFPQALSPFGGIAHYFRSLKKVRELPGIRLALGGHEEPILDLAKRTLEIEEFHRRRLEQVTDLCKTPKTIAGVTEQLFGAQERYGRILAIEEAGAHVEYLHQKGRLKIANLDEVARARDPVIEYVSVS